MIHVQYACCKKTFKKTNKQTNQTKQQTVITQNVFGYEPTQSPLLGESVSASKRGHFCAYTPSKRGHLRRFGIFVSGGHTPNHGRSTRMEIT